MKYPFYLLVLLIACKGKKEKQGPQEPFFPAISFLKSQVAHVDTSLYNIIKIETLNGVSDTTHIRREDFRTYAQEFTSLPEIASDKLKEDYSQSMTFDDALQQVVFVYETREKDAVIKREQVTFDPGPDGSARPRTIYITKVEDQDDQRIQKNLFWQVDRRFSIITMTQAENGGEQVKKLEVVWNTPASAN